MTRKTLFVSSGFAWDINPAVLCSSPLGRAASIGFFGATHIHSVVWTRN